jgi:hypothetical protein
MEPGGAVNVAIVVVLCIACFVGVAWVWAKAIEVPDRRARRRGLSRWQLLGAPLVLLAVSTRNPAGDRVPDTSLLLTLRVGVAVAAIVAVFLFDRDLRLRADDPPERHRLTVWGIGALAAILMGVGLQTAVAATTLGDPVEALWVPGALLALAVVAGLDLLLALAIRRRWRQRAAAAEHRRDRRP